MNQKGIKKCKKCKTMKLSEIQRKYLENIADCDFNVRRCCKSLNITPQAYYHWLRVNPTFALKVNQVEESTIDHVESKLMELVNGVQIEKTSYDGSTEIYDTPPNVKAIEIFLKAKAKKRGYVDKVVTENTSTVTTNLISTPYTDEIKALKNQIIAAVQKTENE